MVTAAACCAVGISGEQTDAPSHPTPSGGRKEKCFRVFCAFCAFSWSTSSRILCRRPNARKYSIVADDPCHLRDDDAKTEGSSGHGADLSLI
ncbi:hypothetical protein EVAR_41025_1 [Eumeta japonica]|uniref:Uncharacterized protein n=1 Tax=Eumeta variegata TaxID=151549 RepID=A0A4C1Z2E1_EUMVA|nr:hypothetical protein EVAR_41025_1 [Eumeta japonica]